MKTLYEDKLLIEKACLPFYIPFLFERVEGGVFNGFGNEPETRRVFVKIALWDMSSYDATWMDCKHIGISPLVPDVDLCAGLYEFDSELEALKFMKNWWATKEFKE